MDEQQWQPTRPGEITVREIVPPTSARTVVIVAVSFVLVPVCAAVAIMNPGPLGNAIGGLGIAFFFVGFVIALVAAGRQRWRDSRNIIVWRETGATLPIRATELAARVPLREDSALVDVVDPKIDGVDEVSMARGLAACLYHCDVRSNQDLPIRAAWFAALEEELDRPVPRLWVIDDTPALSNKPEGHAPVRRSWKAPLIDSRWRAPVALYFGGLILVAGLVAKLVATLSGVQAGWQWSGSYARRAAIIVIISYILWTIASYVGTRAWARRGDDGSLRLVPLIGKRRGFSLEPEECRVVVYRKFLDKKWTALGARRLSPPTWRFMHDATDRVVEVPNFDPAGTAWEPLARELGQVNDRGARGAG